MNLSPWTVVLQPLVTLPLALMLVVPDVNAGIYRWQDSTGTTHYGDTPPTAAHKLKKLKPTRFDSYGRVKKVIDGDTLILTDGRRVRLLGIDAPEVAHRAQPGEPLGEKARRFLTSQTAGKRVQMRYDLQHQDRYNRLLAHVYLEDAKNLNTMLLRKGLAYARFEWPNLQNAEHYYETEKKARNEGKGIWALPAFQVKPMQNLESLRNHFVRLRGRPDRVEKKRAYSYLLFGDKLRVAIKNSRLELFNNSGIELEALPRKTIVLRGWLGRRRGTPFVELSHPYQIERVEGESE